eukprot:1229373-Amphidinium_carterae.1
MQVSHGQSSRAVPSVMSSASSSGVHGCSSSTQGANASWFMPSQTEHVQTEHVGASATVRTGSDMDIRKDRNRLPELDITGSVSDPVQLLHSFEICLLKCSTAISTWSRSPKEAVDSWTEVLEIATQNWSRWSTATATERKMESLQRPVSGRFVDT